MMTKLLTWLSGLDVQAKIIMAFVGLAMVGIAIATAFHVVDALTETAEQKGAIVERAATQGKVIENVKAAKDAGEAVRRDVSVRRDECLRHARNPEDC